MARLPLFSHASFLQLDTWSAGNADLPMPFERRRVVTQTSESAASREEAAICGHAITLNVSYMYLYI